MSHESDPPETNTNPPVPPEGEPGLPIPWSEPEPTPESEPGTPSVDESQPAFSGIKRLVQRHRELANQRLAARVDRTTESAEIHKVAAANMLVDGKPKRQPSVPPTSEQKAEDKRQKEADKGTREDYHINLRPTTWSQRRQALRNDRRLRRNMHRAVENREYELTYNDGPITIGSDAHREMLEGERLTWTERHDAKRATHHHEHNMEKIQHNIERIERSAEGKDLPGSILRVKTALLRRAARLPESSNGHPGEVEPADIATRTELPRRLELAPYDAAARAQAGQYDPDKWPSDYSVEDMSLYDWGWAAAIRYVGGMYRRNSRDEQLTDVPFESVSDLSLAYMLVQKAGLMEKYSETYSYLSYDQRKRIALDKVWDAALFMRESLQEVGVLDVFETPGEGYAVTADVDAFEELMQAFPLEAEDSIRFAYNNYIDDEAGFTRLDESVRSVISDRVRQWHEDRENNPEGKSKPDKDGKVPHNEFQALANEAELEVFHQYLGADVPESVITALHEKRATREAARIAAEAARRAQERRAAHDSSAHHQPRQPQPSRRRTHNKRRG